MKDLFPGYYPVRPNDIVLDDGLLIAFDTNVLLNLYRYPSSTANDLLSVMKALGDRVWLPHQVALEFHRNRVKVIADQRRQFDKVRKCVDDAVKALDEKLKAMQLHKRHSSINPEPLMNAIEEAVNTFKATLEEQQADCQSVTGPDPNQDQLATLFASRVGESPPDQEWMDNVEREGQQRYKAMRPPGYRDQPKSKEDATSFFHRDIRHHGEFGDLILWKQMLVHCRNEGVRQLVFVTDDDKDDWQHSIDSRGKKTGSSKNRVRYYPTSSYRLWCSE